MDNTYLVAVQIKDGVQSNKYYNMYPAGSTFRVEYGRVGSTKTTKTYPISKWSSTYNSKIRKGYKDISNLKETTTVVHEDSGNSAFDKFYSVFSKYTGSSVQKSYLTEGATQTQMDEAQRILNLISKLNNKDDINDNLLELYKVIPRRMGNVNDYLVKDLSDVKSILAREQDALDSMDSNNIVNVTNPYKELGLDFSIGTDKDVKFMEELLYPTRGYNKVNIHKVYKIHQKDKKEKFEKWVSTQKNKSCQHLIHGTRNPNIFSILRSGLLIRPTNAAVISGAAYGEGIYFSNATAKSLNYTGYDSDKIFLINLVHVGNKYDYKGWYYDGKGLSRSNMNYNYLSSNGYDSLHVHAGDGLLRDEFIVYNSNQQVISFLVWLK